MRKPRPVSRVPRLFGGEKEGPSGCPWWGGFCVVAGGGVRGCCGRCNGTHRARIYTVSRQCESACGPPGGAHTPRQRDRDDNDEVFHLRETDRGLTSTTLHYKELFLASVHQTIFLQYDSFITTIGGDTYELNNV